MITGKSYITGVIGGNIKGSLSPLIHNYWYKKHALDAVYVPFQTRIEEFDISIKGLFSSGIRGVNVTVPFKEQAYYISDILTSEAQQAKAVNILYPQEDGRIVGDNSDGIGFIASITHIKPNFNFKKARCLLIGAGGAASGILVALKQKGVTEFYVINRSLQKAEKIQSLFTDTNCMVKLVPEYSSLLDTVTFDIIVNTTTLKNIEKNGVNDIPSRILENLPIVIDINYGFSPNRFLQNAQTFGCQTADGLEMLIRQAVPSFAIFNKSVYPEVDEGLYSLLQRYSHA